MTTDYLNDGMPFLGSNSPAELSAYGGLWRAVHEGVVVRIMRNTYRDARVGDSRELRIAALALYDSKDAIFADDTVAWIQGVDTIDPADRYGLVPSIIVPNGMSRPRHGGARIREGTISEDDTVVVGGLRMQTNLRATADMMRLKWRPNALAAADAMARGGLIVPQELEAFIRPLRRLPGIPQAREIVRLIDPKTMSWGESAMKLRLADAGFPRPNIQFEIVDPRIGRRLLDAAYAERLIAVEYDGRAFHSAEADQRHDATRRAELTDLFGWRWVIVKREGLVGTDDRFEQEVGSYLGMTPQPRKW